MARQTRDGTNAAVVLMGMMVCGMLGGPVLAITTQLPAGLAILVGSGLPVALAIALHLRTHVVSGRRLDARLSAEAEVQRALHGRPEGAAPAHPAGGGIPLRAATLVPLAALSVLAQGTVGGVVSAVLLGGLWACLISPALRRRLSARVPHGDTQIALVQARSETVRGIRLSEQSAGRSSSGSDRQSRQDHRQVGSSTTRA